MPLRDGVNLFIVAPVFADVGDFHAIITFFACGIILPDVAHRL